MLSFITCQISLWLIKKLEYAVSSFKNFTVYCTVTVESFCKDYEKCTYEMEQFKVKHHAQIFET